MYRTLLAGTALAALATPLAAQTTIDNARTTPVKTSELRNGQGDDLKIGTNGTIKPTGGNAVTVDSDNDVTSDGKITVTDANGASGIVVVGPRAADIVNNGTITIDETYTPTDTDKDGDLDGGFAKGTGRTGIRVGGALTGNVVQAGTITVEGNQSAGVSIDGPLTGAFTHNGRTTVVGDQSVAVAAQDIRGNVRLAGQVGASGAGSVGARFAGDIDGALVVQGVVTASGYRSTTAPSDVSKLDADDLLQGGGALIVEGDVAKGIVFDVAPRDTKPDDKDEDGDGIQDDKEGNARISSYGSAPAVAIGATNRDIAIGATQGAGNGFGIVFKGELIGDGVYTGVAGTGMALGGRGGGVTVAGGLQNDGGIGGAAKNANATALLVGNGTVLPTVANTGTIAAAVTGTSGRSAALLVDANASLPLVKNSGVIRAVTIAEGSAYAILDRSGTLSSVENSGAILAGGAKAGAGRNVAIDLSQRTGDSQVKQTVAAQGVQAPRIEGDIRFGAGSDLLDIADGTVIGNVAFGAGDNRLKLSGDAIYSGNADFAGGAGTLSIANTATFAGKLVGAQNTAVAVSGGSLFVNAPTTVRSLDVGATGVVGVTLGSDPAASGIVVNGAANFAQGAKIGIALSELPTLGESYRLISAGTLTGADKLATTDALLPFMFKAALAVSGNTVNVDIDRKNSDELGLNRSEAAAFDGLYEALAEDDDVAKIFLNIADAQTLQAYVGTTLPDHAGGGFEGLSQALRAFDRHLTDPIGPIDQQGKFRIVADFATWKSRKDRGDSMAYDLDGSGVRGGVEYLTGIGAFGLTGSWLWNKHEAPFDNKVDDTSYEGGVHWRGTFGPLAGFARVGIGRSDFEGSRRFQGGAGEDAVSFDIRRDWSGDFVSATGGVSLEGGSQFFFFRPSIALDYLRLKEDGSVETGGGDALNLTIGDRTSKELALDLATAAGVDLFGMQRRDPFWLRIEGEGGWRQLLSSDLGTTRAHYADGDDFLLVPEERQSGWFARLRGYGGNGFYTIGADVGAEEQFGKIGYNFRASVRFGW
ncbi:autotransporter domain-containing protein [Erythrobacter sp. 3-20A1M]|uniref:autotransporter outer membrane beta-barrel domain-containing protein n=1 Tax=Erythrobacter sp. 3-20A1M TaxID=2653850 RepID=UPI001BFCC33D|nr:autotransporter outer membrane beta-barrel domain-containing protein [Erythrobacter sp. 3-20A1M]QWC57312.1 autotransporter domain-containing protein [Erythrobacter sp. 3-20A1M]